MVATSVMWKMVFLDNAQEISALFIENHTVKFQLKQDTNLNLLIWNHVVCGMMDATLVKLLMVSWLIAQKFFVLNQAKHFVKKNQTR